MKYNEQCRNTALNYESYFLMEMVVKTQVFAKDMIPCQWVSVPDISKRRSAFIFKGLEIREESTFFSDLCSVMYWALQMKQVL